MSERPIRECLLATHNEGDRAHRVQPQGMRGQTGRSGHRPLGRCAGAYRYAREGAVIAPTPVLSGDALVGRKLGVLHTDTDRHSPTTGRARNVAERWKADEAAGISSAVARRSAGSAAGRGDGARHSLCIGHCSSRRCVLCLSARRGVLPRSRSEAADAAFDRPAVLFEHMLMRVSGGITLH